MKMFLVNEQKLNEKIKYGWIKGCEYRFDDIDENAELNARVKYECYTKYIYSLRQFIKYIFCLKINYGNLIKIRFLFVNDISIQCI